MKAVSYGAAVVMLILYAAYLVHSLQRPQARPRATPSRDPLDRPPGRRRARPHRARHRRPVRGAGRRRSSPTIEDTGIGDDFIGLIIVPLIGNVAEHAAAIRIAWRGDFDFSMGISFNSALQVAFGVTAIAVLRRGLVGHELSIVFPSLQIALLAASAIMAGLIAADGEANWLEGIELIAIYILAAIAFWYL